MGEVPRTKYRLYWASQPPPGELTAEHLARLVPVDFSTEQDAIHAAALVMRAGDFVWRIERPEGEPLTPAEVAAKCTPLLELFATMSAGSR